MYDVLVSCTNNMEKKAKDQATCHTHDYDAFSEEQSDAKIIEAKEPIPPKYRPMLLKLQEPHFS